MKQEDREKDIRERREEYTRGLVAVYSAVEAFTELTGVDLTGDVDISGKHMGRAPFVKLTAERLTEITDRLNSELAELTGISDEIAVIAESITQDAVVIDFRRGAVSAVRPTGVPS